MIDENVQKFIGRLRGLEKSGEVIRCVVAASAFSAGKDSPIVLILLTATNGSRDVIMTYAFGRSYKRLEKADFDAHEYDSTHAAASFGWVIKHFVWILSIVKSLPTFAQKAMGEALATFVTLQDVGYRAQLSGGC